MFIMWPTLSPRPTLARSLPSELLRTTSVQANISNGSHRGARMLIHWLGVWMWSTRGGLAAHITALS